jgi:hypothetical protein
MARSRRFIALLKRLDTLRHHFLPEAFSPIGQYDVREYDLARAYVLLVHAEIESYLEDRARDVADTAEKRWKKKGSHSNVIRSVFGFHSHTKNEPWKPFDKTPAKIQSALNSYATLISNNHGIKEANVCRLLFPIGIEYRSLNATWLINLDSFGSFRGSLAHLSSIKTQQPVDPETEFKRVAEIVKGLRSLDRKINRLK